jgi:hypothetical protein
MSEKKKIEDKSPLSGTGVSTIPDSIPKESSLKYTIKIFGGFDSFCKFCDDIEVENKKAAGGSRMQDTYLDVYKEIIKQQERGIKNEDDFFAGLPPYPKSIADAMARTTYNHMDDYNKFYKEVIQPLASELLNESKADLDAPVIKYNDKELGFFDFSRASSGLFPKYAYYSFKYKKIVDGNLVETYKEDGKYKYKLKEDGSPCIIMPMVKEGKSL